MFDNYPKTRPPLPKESEKIFSSYYKLNREGKTTASYLSQRMESWLHRKVASDVAHLQESDKVTLELGAGTLNQLPYEPAIRNYDIIEPSTYFFENSPLLSRIRNIYSDISEIPGGIRYDRITSTATLEHICNLPEVVAKSGLLLADDGVFRASIPSEGSWLWTLGWRLTTGIEFRLKYGVDYGLLNKHEHVNTAKEIAEILEYFFESIQYEVFGLSKSISFYQFYECRAPRIDRCREYTKSLCALAQGR